MAQQIRIQKPKPRRGEQTDDTRSPKEVLKEITGQSSKQRLPY